MPRTGWNGPLLKIERANRYAVEIDAHLSEVQSSSYRDDADRRLPVLLRLQRLRRTDQASFGRLLCFLFLRFCAVSANPREWQRRMLSSVVEFY
jgi:hypothetical protein